MYYALGHPLPTLLVGSPSLHSWPLWEQGDNCWHWQGMTGKHILDSAASSGAMAKRCSETEPHPASLHFCGGQMLILPRPPSLPYTDTSTNGASAAKQYRFQGVCVGPGRRGHLNEQLGVFVVPFSGAVPVIWAGGRSTLGKLSSPGCSGRKG